MSRVSSLQAQRDRRQREYAQARRRHRGQEAASKRLMEITTAMLKAEVAATKPQRGRPRNPRPVAPDLFQGAHA
jgi:hypothetical protein